MLYGLTFIFFNKNRVWLVFFNEWCNGKFGAAAVARGPGVIALWAGLSFTWWEGKYSDGGHMGS